MRRLLALLAASALSLAACEDPGSMSLPVPSEPSTAGTAPLPADAPDALPAASSSIAALPRVLASAAPSAAPSAALPPEPSPLSLPAPPTPVACEDPAMDLASTALGAWLAAQVIPTDQPGVSFSFEVVDNQFSPCADLSWVVLSGTDDGPAPETGPPREAVVFFLGADLVTVPAPVQLPPGGTVDDHGEGSVRVSWEGGGQATYRLSGDGLTVDGEPPGAPRLDLGRAGPPATEAPRPHGNAYSRPWDQERPRGERYSMMMGQTRITCDFELFNDLQLVCHSATARPWPVLSENVPADTADRANVAILNFQSPWAVSTLTDPYLGAGEDAGMLPDGAVTRIDDVFVDTRNGVVKIYDSRWAYVLGDGFAMPAEVPGAPVDTSRYPQDLRPWDGALN